MRTITSKINNANKMYEWQSLFSSPQSAKELKIIVEMCRANHIQMTISMPRHA